MLLRWTRHLGCVAGAFGSCFHREGFITMGKPYFSRRDFLRRSVLGAGALALPNIIARKSWAEGPREDALKRLTVGVIGVGGRGRDDMRAFLAQRDTQVVAVCDCYADRRQQAVDMVNQAYGNEDCKQYIDMMELLARPDIDAVLIATGDNWHSGVSILAARAGKDIYCEKPLSVCLSESRAVADTMKRLGRVFQCGTQRRSIGHFRYAVHLAQSGKLGELKELHAEEAGAFITPRRAHSPRPAGARA
jgi:predicted dehydrogenase